MSDKPTLRGMATVTFWATDVKAARHWYSELLGLAPYFQRPDAEHPVYVEFRLGDYQHELGLLARTYAPQGSETGAPAGAILYWHVEDLPAMLAHCLDRGATLYAPLIDRGQGFLTAAVTDPFGNILGLMYNPHYLATLAQLQHVTPNL